MKLELPHFEAINGIRLDSVCGPEIQVISSVRLASPAGRLLALPHCREHTYYHQSKICKLYLSRTCHEYLFRVQIGPGAGVFHFIPGPADVHAENEFLVQVNLRLVQYFAIRVILVHHMRFRSTSPVRFVPTRSKVLKRPAATFLAATNEIYTV